MTEQDPFEARLAAALRRYAAEATSDLDPVAFAHLVVTRAPRRRRAWQPARHSTPVLGYAVWLLLLAALLAIALGVGALNRSQRPALGSVGQIAFDTGGHILLSDVAGVVRLDLSSAKGGDYLPSWSPDGTKLAFWRETGPFFSIVIVDPDGRTVATIPTEQATGDPHSMAWAGGAGGALGWSPDSSRLVCWMWVGPQETAIPLVFVVPLDGSGPRRVGDPAIPSIDPVWSSEGDHIAFAGMGMLFPQPGIAVDSTGLFVMDADGANLHRVSRPTGTTQQPDIQSFREPQWQPGGDLIAYPASPDGVLIHVFVVRSDGSGERDLSRDLNLEIGGYPLSDDASPAWSPDGRRIAFIRRAEPTGGYHPVIINADGTNPRVLGDLAVDALALTWSPDGKTVLAYVTNPQSGTGPVVLQIDVDSGRPARTIAVDFDQRAAWQRLPP
ncbi:MAG: TolB family protein [Candidatus Limnocylindrales bacterium]